jgi:hypothetical protein
MVALLVSVAAAAGDLSFGYVPIPEPGQKPALLVTPTQDVEVLYVTVEVGGQTLEFTRRGLSAGQQARFEWNRDTSVTEAVALVLADFTDGHTEEVRVPIRYSYGTALSVDLAHAVADVRERTLTVRVTAPVDRAEIKAYGAHKALLSEEVVAMGGGPGDIDVPWLGDPSTVVLLDVTLYSGNSWAGFTYSPWFLNIPHDEVRFATDQAVIVPEEEHKLEATLQELGRVLEMYGEVVPVKLFIAGCTDTVGDGAHNLDLSRRRARAIASWLRSHGYDRPIYYHGFGETFLAVHTGDGVDAQANRRALYMVGANPPPPSTGVPQVRWTEL